MLCPLTVKDMSTRARKKMSQTFFPVFFLDCKSPFGLVPESLCFETLKSAGHGTFFFYYLTNRFIYEAQQKFKI